MTSRRSMPWAWVLGLVVAAVPATWMVAARAAIRSDDAAVATEHEAAVKTPKPDAPADRDDAQPDAESANANADATDADAANTNADDTAESTADESKAPAGDAQESQANTGQARTEEDQPQHTGSVEPPIKPRLELYVPSVQSLVRDVHRSHTGPFLDQIVALFEDVAAASAEGVDPDALAKLMAMARSWPDATIDAATYAPDTEGRTRWSVRLSWPLDRTVGVIRGLLASESAADLLENVTIDTDGSSAGETDSPPEGGESAAADRRYVIRLPESVLAYVFATGEASCCISSHADIALSAHPYRGSDDSDDQHPPALVCRLNLSKTERDSGAGMLSNFSVVTAIDYAGSVDKSGDWVERLTVRWPPVSGMAIKAFFGRVKHTFFIPDEAFAGWVFDAHVAPAVLEQMAGFGPQIALGNAGELEVLGENLNGPLTAHLRSEMSVIVLPGTGFLPAPDIVVQARAKNAGDFESTIRRAIEKINADHVRREQRPPWHETTLRDRAVFYSDGAPSRGLFVPFAMRPVLFTTTERDAKGKSRDMICVAWTTTSPSDLARRWLDLPRRDALHYLPDARKTSGQAWVHWRKLYDWIHPYLNIAISVRSMDALLPPTEEVKADLTDALLTVRVSYSGLTVDHTGPAPMGVLAVPSMLAASVTEQDAGESDLARERLASRRLKVLYHHCKLFKKDIGRWPATVAELDGYVDFAGNPQLLRLDVSSSTRWRRWFEKMAENKEQSADTDTDEDEGDAGAIDDSLYVIEWGTDHWTLGIAPNTLDHLEKLYIDQDGVIHRVLKTKSQAHANQPESQASSTAG